jgi:hypothetical protein
MRKAMQSWPFRIGALVLSAIMLYATACTLLPRTADGVSVTVLQCATVHVEPVDDCPGTTLLHRTFTDTAIVSGVRTTLDQLPYEVRSIFDHRQSNGVWEQTGVYRVDLLWHGIAVKSYMGLYVAPYPPFWWDVTTLGIVQLWAPGDSTTWQDLVRLTGMPLAPNAQP